MLNYNLLDETIKNTGITKTAIADKMGITRESLYNKLDGKTEFTVSEICSITNALNLSKDDRDAIFFG